MTETLVLLIVFEILNINIKYFKIIKIMSLDNKRVIFENLY